MLHSCPNAVTTAVALLLQLPLLVVIIGCGRSLWLVVVVGRPLWSIVVAVGDHSQSSVIVIVSRRRD